MSASDAAFMRRALELAERGWGQTAPNPMVGAVVVRDGEIVGEGWHERFAAAHAEVNALTVAGDRARGARMYVTLEPCAHHGKTPPCTEAIIRAGVGAVMIAAPEPTRRAGGGADVLARAGIEVRVGVEEAAARELNAAFHHGAESDLPWVTLKLAVSAEGAIAPPAAADGRRRKRWLSGDEARAEVHRMRAGSDAIAVGVGTVLGDDPSLTVRHFTAPRVAPRRVVFDRKARTPLASTVVRTAGEIPTIVVTADEPLPNVPLLRQLSVDIVAARDLTDALRQLRTRGIQSLLVEGGAGLGGALLNAGHVNRLVLIETPVVLGEGALDAFACVPSCDGMLSKFEIREQRWLGQDRLKVLARREANV